jgi:hypothetical protein
VKRLACPLRKGILFHAYDNHIVGGNRGLHLADDVCMEVGDGASNGGMDVSFIKDVASHEFLFEMDADLSPIVAALANLHEGELAALMEATSNVPQIAPGQLAWIEHAADWERHRRTDTDFPPQPPKAAIPPDKDAVSIDAAAIIRAQFAQDGRPESRVVVALFDAIVALQTGREHLH